MRIRGSGSAPKCHGSPTWGPRTDHKLNEPRTYIIPVGGLLEVGQVVQEVEPHAQAPDFQVLNMKLLQVDHLVDLLNNVSFTEIGLHPFIFDSI